MIATHLNGAQGLAWSIRCQRSQKRPLPGQEGPWQSPGIAPIARARRRIVAQGLIDRAAALGLRASE